jgi:transcription elongation factor GreB
LVPCSTHGGPTIDAQMTKAFTKEADSQGDDNIGLPPIPIGGKNYITPAGYARIRAELFELIDVERSKVVEVVHWAASNGDRSENGDYIYGKRRLREIDKRIRFLTKRLELAEIFDPSVHFGSEQIFFGAAVTYEDESGLQRMVTILGIDEADNLKQQVTWVSPIAQTLLRTQVGDVVRLSSPGGNQDIEIIRVEYPKPVL